MTRDIQDWFDAYAVHHQHPTNKLVHWICIPLIFLSVIGLLASVPVGSIAGLVHDTFRPFVHLGTLAILLGGLFYFRLSVPLAIGMLAISALVLLAVRGLDAAPWPLWQSSLAIFVLAWIGQFVGHKIEGAKPSFFEDAQFLLIGPAWLLGFVYRRLGIRY